MADIYFLTSNPVKLSQARHMARGLNVTIRKQEYYGAAYSEPRLEEREELLTQSLKDGVRRMAGVPRDPSENDDLILFEQMPFGSLYYDSFFFIEDTSVIIHALSQPDKEIPGTDIKYWMQETTFKKLDKTLKAKGNNRGVTVRSDVCLHIPKTERLKLGLKESFVQFVGESTGVIADKEYDFLTNPVFPWLDNKSFNKWFIPDGHIVPISMLPIEKADAVDFRGRSIAIMFEWMLANGLIKKQQPHSAKLNRQAVFPFAKNSTLSVSGYPCSGKTTIGEYLSESVGFHHVEASDFMRHAYHQRHGYTSPVPLEQFAAEILKRYPETVVDGVLAEIKKTGIPDVVVTGLRSPEETGLFKERYAGSCDVQNIFLSADITNRFDRSKKRGREDAPPTLADFEERDEVQKNMGLVAIENASSNFITNNSSFESFYQEFKDAFHLKVHPLDLEQSQFINRYERTLEGRILLFFLIDELTSGNREKYTTTEISKGINRIFTANRFQTEKDNVSRYFNFRSHPYFRAFPIDGVVKFSLSATGRSLAVHLARIEYSHVAQQ